MSDSEVLWEGESKDLTSVATGGRVVKKRYKITREFIFEDAGIIGSKEEQIPLWAVRDVDVKQSILQKTRNVGDVSIRVETNDYTGKQAIVLESIETPKEVRNLINEHSRLARELKMRQQQSVNYSGQGPAGPPLVIKSSKKSDEFVVIHAKESFNFQVFWIIATYSAIVIWLFVGVITLGVGLVLGFLFWLLIIFPLAIFIIVVQIRGCLASRYWALLSQATELN